MSFDFKNTKMNLEGINKYLESQGVKLTNSEKQKINTIFKESDTWNEEKKASGSDGVLNAAEAAMFVTNLNSFSQKIKDGVNNLIEGLGLQFKPVRKEIEVAPADKTRVNNPVKLSTLSQVKENVTTSSSSIKHTTHLVQTEIKNKGIKLSSADVNYWATKIDNIARKYNVPSALMLAIVSRETGFTKNVNSQNGAGPMGVTTIAVKDFFPAKGNDWTDIYKKMDGDLLNDILNTKTKGGKKITTPAQLRAECAKNDELGMKVGLLCFEMNYCKAVATKLFKKANFNTIPKAIEKIKNGYRLSASENEKCIKTALKNYNSVFSSYAPAVVDSLKVLGINFAGLTFIS